MFPWIDVYRLNHVSCEISSLLFLTFVKSLAVFGFVCLLVAFAKKLTPAHRHLFWCFAVGTVVVIPLVSTTAPQLRPLDLPFLVSKKAAIERTLSALSPKIDYAVRLPAPGGSPSAREAVRFPLPRPSWAFFVTCAWAAGALYSTLWVLFVFARLSVLTMRAETATASRVASLLPELKRSFGIRRGVRVLVSGETRIPFSCYTARPAVVLPREAARWSKGRLRAVLSHELAHVKRLDFLVRALSRTVCSVFWPAPFLWVAHSNLHAEQEKACDAFCVRSGEKPYKYAAHLVSLAKAYTRVRPLAAGLFLERASGSGLEKRILAILRARRETLDARLGRFLKPFGACLLLALPLMFLHTEVGKMVGKPMESDAAVSRFLGTWVNETISGNVAVDQEPQKWVITADMEIECWQQADQPLRNAKGTLQPAGSWIGTDGHLYTRVRVASEEPCLHASTELWRIDPTGTRLEKMWRPGLQEEFPSEIDPTQAPASVGRYCVYYRR